MENRFTIQDFEKPTLYIIYKILIVVDKYSKKDKVITKFFGILSDIKEVDKMRKEGGWSAVAVDKDFKTMEGNFIWIN